MNVIPFRTREFSGSAEEAFLLPEVTRIPSVRDSGTARGVRVLASYACTVSIIVVSFNTRDLLRECLRSILAECERLPHEVSAEILVVDNASTDGSPEMV